MELTTQNGTHLKFYDSIKEIPSRTLMQFQIHLMQHQGMGSTFDELDRRFEMLDTFLSAGRIEDAIRERENMRLGFFVMFQGIDTKCVAAACLVREINGKAVSITSDEQIQAVAKAMQEGDITTGQLDEVVFGVKKNSMPN